MKPKNVRNLYLGNFFVEIFYTSYYDIHRLVKGTGGMRCIMHVCLIWMEH